MMVMHVTINGSVEPRARYWLCGPAPVVVYCDKDMHILWASYVVLPPGKEQAKAWVSFGCAAGG